MRDWTNLAHWYDAMNPWADCDDFYLDLVLAERRVLDVGCGTGTILKRARARGHDGRLCGIDPDPDMLDQAVDDPGVEWHRLDAASMPWRDEFDLAFMTGHAFQAITDDEVIAASLATIGRCLRPGGRFAFETRHPGARAWEGWNTSFEVTNDDGEAATVTYAAAEVEPGLVDLTETMTGRWWPEPQVMRSRLRFLDPAAITEALADAGFLVDAQFGAWDRSPLGASSREIITIASI